MSIQGFNYMDLAVAIIIILFSVLGYKKGFVRSIVGTLSLVASVALAWLIYPVVSDLFVAMGIKGAVYESIQSSMQGYIADAQGLSMLPKFMRIAIEEGSREAIAGAAQTASGMILNIVAFIAVLIVSRIVIFIAQKLLIAISKVPMVNALNKLMGTMLGVIRGALVVFIIFTIVYAAIPLKEDSEIGEALEKSAFAGKLYDANPIVKIFDKGEATEKNYIEENQNGE